MTKRGWLAVAILAVWGATLGFHVKRLYFRPYSDLLAAAARTIPPGTAYYAVFRGDRQIGWAQTDVDTLPSATGFLLRDRLIIREPLAPGLDPIRLESEATLGPTFTLERFTLNAQGIPGIRHVQGEVHGDSTLDVTLRGVGETRRERVALEEPVVVAAAWPLRFAARREVEAGERYRLDIYDPLAGGRRPVEITVLRDAERTFPDSVTAVDGRYVTARRDTVHAWEVEHDVSGLAMRAWVDEDGRILEASLPGGIRLERTAFEFAYFGEHVPDRVPGPVPPGAGDEGGADGAADAAEDGARPRERNP